MRRIAAAVGVAVLVGGAGLSGQSTGMPSYNAPYRAFERHEFGGTLSFPEGDITGLEGQFGFGYKTFDFGLRGGILDGEGSTRALFGGKGRVRVVTHNETFPLDGAVIFGAGTIGFDNLIVPGGVSLGRRVDFENSNVSIVPYGQPTLFLVFDDNDLNDTIQFGLGLGIDVRFGNAFDLRASFGVGDFEGFAVSAVWVR